MALREDVKRLVASIALSQDTEQNWRSSNPVIPSGVLVLSTDVNKIKVGNGSSTWSELEYKIDETLTTTEKALLTAAGQANGVVVADASGLVPLSQIPVLTEDKLPVNLRGGIVRFVADIAARDALTEKDGLIYVLDASSDTTVESGAAQYVWDESTSAWKKIGESESLDLDLTNYFNYATMDSDDITEGDTHLFMTPAERASVAQTATDLGTLEQTVATNKQAADATQTELTNYKTSNDAAVAANQSAAEAAQAAADAAQGDVDALEGQFAAYKTANDAAVAANAAAASAAQAAADAAQGDIDAHKSTYATDKAALEQSIQDVSDALDTLTGGTATDLSTINSRLDALDKETTGRVSVLEGKMTTAEGKIAANEGAISALQTRAGEIEGAATALTGRVTTAEGKITTAEGKITTLEGEMDAVEGRATTLEGEMDAVEGRLDTAEGKISTLEGKVATLETTAADAVLYSHEDDLIIGGMNAATMKALYTA